MGLLPRLPRFDPSFMILASVASVEALFLAEHEITRLITPGTAMAERAHEPRSRR
jgi:hypothetical protein